MDVFTASLKKLIQTCLHIPYGLYFSIKLAQKPQVVIKEHADVIYAVA